MMDSNLNFLRESIICHVCKTGIFNSGVLCEICHTWLHIKCIKITQKHYNQLTKSPFPYYCQSCISKALPLTTITNHVFSLETFTNTTTSMFNDALCKECTTVIGSDKHIKCKLSNHSFHLKCVKNVHKSDINYKLWSCNDCLNFPFQNLKSDDILWELAAAKNKPLNKINFDNNFKQFKSIPALNINLNPTNGNEDNFLNFEYYDIDNFLSLAREVPENYMSFFHTNIRSLYLEI